MEEKKREVVISGLKSPEIKTENDIKYVFEQLSLNFLEISKTSIESFSNSINRLDQLISLSLHHNQLKELPKNFGKLERLKNLDLSYNQLVSVPEWSEMTCLESINISGNKISHLPSVRGLTKLHVFNASGNALESLPEDLFSEELSLLSEVHAENNKINDLPADVAQARALKMLLLDNNLLQTLPLEICELHKLKQLGLKDNKFKDKKLARLCATGQVKHIFEHVRKTVKSAAGSKVDTKAKASKKQQKSRAPQEEVGDVISVVSVEQRCAVTACDNVSDVRPYLVCCIVRDVNLESPAVLKKFISAQVRTIVTLRAMPVLFHIFCYCNYAHLSQTKLHESVCNYRRSATIATHDLSKVKSPLVYDAKDPKAIMVF